MEVDPKPCHAVPRMPVEPDVRSTLPNSELARRPSSGDRDLGLPARRDVEDLVGVDLRRSSAQGAALGRMGGEFGEAALDGPERDARAGPIGLLEDVHRDPFGVLLAHGVIVPHRLGPQWVRSSFSGSLRRPTVPKL